MFPRGSAFKEQRHLLLLMFIYTPPTGSELEMYLQQHLKGQRKDHFTKLNVSNHNNKHLEMSCFCYGSWFVSKTLQEETWFRVWVSRDNLDNEANASSPVVQLSPFLWSYWMEICGWMALWQSVGLHAGWDHVVAFCFQWKAVKTSCCLLMSNNTKCPRVGLLTGMTDISA